MMIRGHVGIDESCESFVPGFLILDDTDREIMAKLESVASQLQQDSGSDGGVVLKNSLLFGDGRNRNGKLGATLHLVEDAFDDILICNGVGLEGGLAFGALATEELTTEVVHVATDLSVVGEDLIADVLKSIFEGGLFGS